METCKKCNNENCIEYGRRKTKELDINFMFRARAASIKRDKKSLGIPVMEGLGPYLIELWNLQKGLCYYSELEMQLTNYAKNRFFATVDRIIPELGYVRGNVALCCSIINKMKQDLTLKELDFWCQTILDKRSVCKT